jgi:hypothetical protein
MRNILVALAFLATITPALGQSCQPYWRAGIPFDASMHVVEFDDGSGSTVYLSRGNPPAVWRWHGDEFAPLPTTGLPGQAVGGWVIVLDDGSGPGLYFLLRISLSPQVAAGFKWNGNGWTAMSAAFYAFEGVQPFASTELNGAQRIFGRLWSSFTNPGLYLWNGTSWDLFASTSGRDIASVFRYHGELFAIGPVTTIGGVATQGVARWDGENWHNVPGYRGTYQGGFDMVEFDDGTGPALYLTSIIIGSSTQYHPGVFKFDGETFTPIGYTAPPPSQGWITWVKSLRVFDDGRGPALYIAGGFPQFGLGSNLVACNGIVRWDGQNFEPLGVGGTNEFVVRAPTEWGDALLSVGPYRTSFGGGTAPGSAFWVGCPNCYVNCDDSDVSPRVNIADFSCFLQKFARNDPYANCNVDATIDIADFACFLQQFAAGCP